jgi:hypothetical protein
MDPEPVQLPAGPDQRLDGFQYLQDFEPYVQTIACWLADHFARTALWPSQATMWREMIRRQISPDEVLRDGILVFDNFTASPSDNQFVSLRSWALFDSGRCKEAFTTAYAVYLEIEKQLQDRDSTRLTHENVTELSGLAPDGQDIHRALWVLFKKYGGAWDYKTTRSNWAQDFGVGMLTFPRPTIEKLLLLRYTGTPPKRLVSISIDPKSNFGTVEKGPGRSVSEAESDQLFLITRKLGEGVYADVWLAQDTALDREVALKIVRPDAPGAQNALTHARALARVQHPNIVTVYQVKDDIRDPITARSAAAVVMEYVRGPSLEDVFNGPALETTRARRIGAGLVAAVIAYHESGLAHTDLHDGNVVVSDDHVKVLDPLYFETALMQSTASRHSFQARDGRDLRDLLTRLLRKSNVSAHDLVSFAAAPEHDPRSLGSAFAKALDIAIPDQVSRSIVDATSSAAPTTTSPGKVELKGLLSEDRFELDVIDRVKREVRRVLDAVSDERLICSGTIRPTPEEIVKRIFYYEEVTSPLCSMVAEGCYWGRPVHDKIWRDAIERLATRPQLGGVNIWLNLRQYPALLAMYALGITAAARPNYGALKALLIAAAVWRDSAFERLSNQLFPFSVLGQAEGQSVLPGMAQHLTPLSDRLVEVLRPAVQPIFPDASEYAVGFTRYEFLHGLVIAQFHAAETGGDPWIPMGRYAWNSGSSRQIRQLEREAVLDGAEWPAVKTGVFHSLESFKSAKAVLDRAVKRTGWLRSWPISLSDSLD